MIRAQRSVQISVYFCISAGRGPAGLFSFGSSHRRSVSYPMAWFCVMSRSVGMGDATGLRDKRHNEWVNHQNTEQRKEKQAVPYLSGRIGSSSRFNVPWIPWQSSAGISVPWRRSQRSVDITDVLLTGKPALNESNNRNVDSKIAKKISVG